MIKGIVLALSACFIWGLVFVVPKFMDGFSSLEIALGRYFFYAMISIAILCQALLAGKCRYPKSVWIKTLSLSFASTVGYYTFLVLGLRYSSPAICALILGMSPITIAFYGNWVKKECSFKSLIAPSILILAGLVLINLPYLYENHSINAYLIGLACSFWALMAWSWYAVANAHFLKNHPEVASSDWSTLIGVTTFVWVLALGVVLIVFFGDEIDGEKYYTMSPMLSTFLMGSAVLGLLCSWVGGYLWNCASHYIPVSLAGQLTIFETIFGLCFVYALEQHLPPVSECAAIALFLAAIAYGIHATSTSEQVAA